MTDIERELRALGDRTRGDEGSRSVLSGDALRRIRLRRFAIGTTGVLVIAALGIGGGFTVQALRTNDTTIGPAHASPSPTASEAMVENVPRCGPPVDFKPTYVPDGWVETLQPGSGGGAEWRGMVGHFGNAAPAGTVEKADGGFADLIAGESPYPLFEGQKIRVLDEAARFGPIHEGYSVEFTQHGCNYILLGYGIRGDELRRFAEELRLPGTYVPAEPADDDYFGALWPEDTAEEAKDACAKQAGDPNLRGNPMATAIGFAKEVLDWTLAELITRETGHGGQSIEIRRSRADNPREPDGTALLVLVSEVFPDCWSVFSVSRLSDDRPANLSISVRGPDVEIGFDDLGADSIYFEIGHGYYTNSSDPEPPDGRITALLNYPRGDTGHYLLLFKDENEEVFSAAGGPLPAGDFSAG
ncbi:MAG: hypothetical protein ACRDI3_03725 [Actinomycetota bacterium]